MPQYWRYLWNYIFDLQLSFWEKNMMVHRGIAGLICSIAPGLPERGTMRLCAPNWLANLHLEQMFLKQIRRLLFVSYAWFITRSKFRRVDDGFAETVPAIVQRPYCVKPKKNTFQGDNELHMRSTYLHARVPPSTHTLYYLLFSQKLSTEIPIHNWLDKTTSKILFAILNLWVPLCLRFYGFQYHITGYMLSLLAPRDLSSIIKYRIIEYV